MGNGKGNGNGKNIVKYCLDANALITPWSIHYQIETFPSLWKELTHMKEKFVIIKPIFDEITGEIDDWLKDNSFTPEELSAEDEQLALDLRKKYDTQPNPGSGASKNDIKLITYAKNKKYTVVTYEAKQPEKARPSKMSNYKIPLICSCESVTCITFSDMLKRIEIKL